MQGQCLCGEVKFSVNPKSNDITACHCSICRRQSGGISFSLEVDFSSLIFESEANISIFNSSKWAHRGFCKKCGTMIFWKMNDSLYCNMNHFLINLDFNDISFTTEIFIEEQPKYYSFKNETIKMTEKDILNL